MSSFRIDTNTNNQLITTSTSSLTLGVEEVTTAGPATDITADRSISIVDNTISEQTVNLPTDGIDEGTIKLVRLHDIAGFNVIIQNTNGITRLNGDHPQREFIFINGKWETSTHGLYSYFPNRQQGSKITPSDMIGNAFFGIAIDISSDGNTIIAGGQFDNATQGAAWIFVRSSDGIWSQQQKLTVSDNIGVAPIARSVAISGDGNTVAIGGQADNTNQGATWIFIRSGLTWSQQTKIIGTGNTGAARQGWSIALNFNGNVLAAGGKDNAGSVGAVWIHDRNSVTGVWTQNNILVGTGNTGASAQGTSVSLSSDGKTMASGGSSDNANQGAVWVFTETAGVWTQQGAKLVSTDNVGAAKQGFYVALSSDGNILAVSGHEDNAAKGAVFIYGRSAGVWVRQGPKIVPNDENGNSNFGVSIGISADGNTLIGGGPADDANKGATWVFTRSNELWTQQGSKKVGLSDTTNNAQGYAVSISKNATTFVTGGFPINAAWVFH